MDRNTETGFQTKTALRRLLDEAGISPRRRHGQNFLIDRNLMQKLIDAAELGTADYVLEVGAGTGSLTSMLARSAGRVVAVEIDGQLARIAEEQLAKLDNVILINADALDNKSTIAHQVDKAVRRAQAEVDGPLRMVANLPYDIATPLVMNLLLGDLPIGRLCFTVQKEVADRLLAEAGTAQYGPVSIVTQVLCTGHRICKVPPQAFWPTPKVHSTMVRLDVRPAAEVPVDDPAGFAAFVRAFFLHRRKTIGHSARQRGPHEGILAAITRAGLDPGVRPEQLSTREWVNLHQATRR
ncbi:MAG: ribosomal RNA small subunit methyltransferase A [Phycisphaerae bacterium]|nr:ribosomal RNA small subunit methyltransferase A [Phycisphaerae bacterium]